MFERRRLLRAAVRQKQISPLEFFSHLVWLDGRPLLDVIEPYRRKIFMDVLYTFDPDGRPRYNRALLGRAKKCWKSADLILAGSYRFFVWGGVHDNTSAVVANDEDQAGDDLELLRKLIRANPILAREVDSYQKEIVRRDGKGKFSVLPARDAISLHGKTFCFLGYDEVHGHRNYDIFEVLALDPTRLDSLEWVTSYASIFNTPGAPLFDMVKIGKEGSDPRMYFSWYASDFTTDPDLQGEHITPEQRANPSMASWNNPGYLAQQRRRLPTHKYRRLHLNLPGMPDGTIFDAERVLACTVEGRRVLKPQPGIEFVGFTDMAGGSNDDATQGIAHLDPITGRAVLDLVIAQTGTPPFNPRDAVAKFAAVLKEYGCYRTVGDRFAGATFAHDFQSHGISYTVCPLTKHQLYEALEPRINAHEIVLLDLPKLQEQLLGLVIRGGKIDHLPGEHDDFINAGAGALWLTQGEVRVPDGSLFAAGGVTGPAVSAFDAYEEQARLPQWLRDLGGLNPSSDWE